MNDTVPTLLLAHTKIVETVSRFGMLVDARDWDGFRNLFADSVEFDYSDIGDVSGTLSPVEIAKNASAGFNGFKTTQHVVTNHQVDVTDEASTCTAYVRAMHLLPNDKGESWLEIGGQYDAKLIRSESDWKIQSWKFSVMWSRGNSDLFSLAKNQ